MTTAERKPDFTIVPRETVQREDAIDLLKSYLKMAEQGELTTVAIACIKPDGTAEYGFSHTHQYPAVLGAVQFLASLVERTALKSAEDLSDYDEEDSTT
jgi:hypothetical protein